MDVCREYQTAADRLIALEDRAAREDRIVGLLQARLRCARSEMRGWAIAARAAEGAASALASYIREGLAVGGQAEATKPEQLLLFATP
jgi:hypothetical protein